MPPEKSAYALARYSRSPDSVAQSLEWVRSHSAEKFLDSFYFQYGHASIADLGHAIFCFEGVSELAAIEIEDEPLWDGQAKSSRYQDFSVGATITPSEIAGTADEPVYREAANALLAAYLGMHGRLVEHLREALPRPADMQAGRYERTIAARAYDGVRYLLFLGISTNLGQVTSIRTLEKQMQRLGVSPYGELRELAVEMKQACAAPPACVWDASQAQEALAPTLAKYADPDVFARQARDRVRQWAAQNVQFAAGDGVRDVDLAPNVGPLDEIVATWLYGVSSAPYRVVLDEVSGWSSARKNEVIDLALQGRDRRDELLREFKAGYQYVFDVVCDIGAYRDLHRHRRCVQIRQDFCDGLGFETPELIEQAGLGAEYQAALDQAAAARTALPEKARDYLLPFAARCRTLYKMDFAEAEYIARVRSGVKGHISYRRVAWEIRNRVLERDPALGRLIHATPPEIEDPLTR
ncbi:MAG: alternative thymidylate synthase-like protein [Acidobacteria bacterium]|nr:alternative thymidylate synthase-like protein [Acidobacteriota bacterium]